ncbi:MAG: hypothetical protein Fur002_12930 [Anaerolineales bacterium]
MKRKQISEWLICAALVVAILAPRLAALGSFATLDEPYWLSMGANFYYALGQREFENTVYEYQPAVTTMWIVTAALLIYFPEYRGLGQGYLDFEKGLLDPFLIEHDKSPLELFLVARTLQVLLVTALFLVLYGLLKKIFPRWAAAFAVLFAAFDPYFLGQSRLLNHEALVALFVSISLLALYLYFKQEKKSLLILSGIAAGLAQLTKSSAIAMLLPVIVILWMEFPAQRWRTGKVFAAWLALLVGTYVLAWPGMWVAPAKMLYVVYGNAFSYSLQGARLAVTEELEPARFALNANLLKEIWYFVSVWMYRTTPFTWMGIILAGLFTWMRRISPPVQETRRVALILLSTAAAFILLFAISQGRNSPHYILTSYLALNLFAALGFSALKNQRAAAALLMLFLTAQAWSALARAPYYYTYRSPILHAAGWYADFPQKAYGEGLEQAAAYLAAQPGAADSSTLVYYSRGCFSFFYSGESLRFKPYYAEAAHKTELREALNAADYLVIYFAVQGKLEKYQPLLNALAEALPAHEIWLDGYRYVLIYDLRGLSPAAMETLLK